MEKKSWENKDIEQFCEDNFFDEEMQGRLLCMMQDFEGSMEVEVDEGLDPESGTLIIKIKIHN